MWVSISGSTAGTDWPRIFDVISELYSCFLIPDQDRAVIEVTKREGGDDEQIFDRHSAVLN